MSDIEEENSLSHVCIQMVDAKSLVLEYSTRAVCIVILWRLWWSSVCVIP